jgi:hypothetical protein
MKRALCALLLLAGCAAPVTPAQLAAPGSFNPIAFFTGHVTSWGVEENRANQPTGIVTTDCTGTANPTGGITMQQTLHLPGGKTQTRTWHLTQTSPTTYQATANDMDGTTAATISGRAMHWRWILETNPANRLENVTMDQWFYQMRDGSVVIRTNVSKAGIRLLGITEQFEKA